MSGVPGAAGGRTGQVASFFSGSSEYWDDVYSSSKVKAQVYRNRMAVAVEWAQGAAGPGGTAADIGTGAGHLAVALARRGIRVAAVDASGAMVAQAARNAARAGVAGLVDPVASDAQRLELGTATCDVTVALGLLPWVSDPGTALREMARVTRPGGHVIVTMDNALSLARGLDPLWHPSARALAGAARRLLPGPPPPACWPSAATPGRFRRLLHDAGLEPLEFAGVGFGPFTFLGHGVLPNTAGLAADRALQRLADAGTPLISHTAVFNIALARKPAPVTQRASEAGH